MSRISNREIWWRLSRDCAASQTQNAAGGTLTDMSAEEVRRAVEVLEARALSPHRTALCRRWTRENVSRMNEKFATWRELPHGGRVYSYDVKGRSGWRARYVKEVDAEESTVRFYQEVYDGDGKLREVHHKYPVDLGHQEVTGDEP